MRTFLICFVTSILAVARSFGADEPDLNLLSRPVIGVTVVSTDDAAPHFKKNKLELPTKLGVVVTDVNDHGPAKMAKVGEMNIITNINKKPVHSKKEFEAMMAGLEPGKPAEFTGWSIVKTPEKKNVYKKGNLKITPVTYKALLFNSLKVTEDKFKESKFYEHKDSGPGNELLAYIGVASDKKPTLRLKMKYVADDWLFVRQFEFKSGSEVCVITPPLSGVTRDNARGLVWEYYDTPATNDHLDFLKSVIKTKAASMRYVGRTSVSDRELTEGEISRLKEMMLVYQVLLADYQASPK